RNRRPDCGPGPAGGGAPASAARARDPRNPGPARPSAPRPARSRQSAAPAYRAVRRRWRQSAGAIPGGPWELRGDLRLACRGNGSVLLGVARPEGCLYYCELSPHSTSRRVLSQSPAPILRVAVPSPLRKLFDYRCLPDQPPPAPGCRVRVPFGRQELVGIVIEHAETSSHPDASLKAVLEVLDSEPLLDEHLLGLYRWASDYWLHPLGLVLQTSLPTALRGGKPAVEPRILLWVPTGTGLQADVSSLGQIGRAHV